MTSKKLHAVYLDGRTSKKKECEVRLNTNHLTISYLSDGYEKSSTWQINSIRKLDVITSSRTLKHGVFPPEVLEFNSKQDFDLVLETYPGADFHKSSYNQFQKFGIKGIFLASIGVIGFSLLFFLYGAPFIADQFAQNIPNEYEEYIGENLHNTYMEFFTIDSAKSEKIQSFYNNLNYQSEYNISVVVVESDQVNAFALPGGYIVVFSGILEVMDDEDELAALLAHEVSHINNRHSVRILSRQLAMYLLFASLSGDVAGFSSIIIEHSNMVSSLSFSRKFEKEADLEGFNLMLESNINPEGMLRLFEKINAISDSLSLKMNLFSSEDSLSMEEIDSVSIEDKYWKNIGEMLSTHPSPKNRISYLKEEISNINSAAFYMKQDSLKLYFDLLKQRE